MIQSLKNRKVYVGFTKKNPEERLREHNSKSNTFTSLNGPWVLRYYETYYCEKCARTREKFYKSGFGKKIKKLILDGI